MWALLGFLLMLLILLLLMALIRTQTDVHLTYENRALWLRIKIRLFFGLLPIGLRVRARIDEVKGLVLERIRRDGSVIAPIEFKKKKKKKEKKEPRIQVSYRLIRDILRGLKPKKLHIQLCLGLEDDAYNTAMICGYAQVLMGALEGYLRTRNRKIDMQVSIQGNFKEKYFVFRVHCIISLRTEHIIIAIMRGIREQKTNKRGLMEHASASH